MSAVDHDDRFSPEPTQPTPESRLKELKLDIPAGIQLRLDTVFPKVTGWGWKNQIKTKCKLLSNVSHELDDLLYEGEEVLYIAKGIRYSFWEFYFMGIWAMMINHTVFVLTNLRLIMIHTDSKGRPKKTFWAIFYSQIQKFKGTWNGMMNLKLKDGKSCHSLDFPRLTEKRCRRFFRRRSISIGKLVSAQNVLNRWKICAPIARNRCLKRSISVQAVMRPIGLRMKLAFGASYSPLGEILSWGTPQLRFWS